MADRNYFPEDFVPTKFHVICGRGKKSYGHVGNQWFLTVVSGRINDYARADNKQEKSEIVQKLVAEIRDEGGFIRQDEQSGRYYRVVEGEGRDKVSQALRDALKHKYKSSKDVKRTNRKAKRLSTRTNSMGSRRGSMGNESERSVGSGYYSGAEVEAVGSVPSLAQVHPSPLLKPAPLIQPGTPTSSAPTDFALQPPGQLQPRSRSIAFPAVETPSGPQSQQQQAAIHPRSQSIGAVPGASKPAWNASLYVVPTPGQQEASIPVQGQNRAPTQQQQPAGISNLQRAPVPVQAFPDVDMAALGYNQPHQIAQQVSKNNDYQGKDFQHHRRPSAGASSYASTSNASGIHSSGGGSARDYWSGGEPSGEWDKDGGGDDVDLDFCLDLDDMEQQAKALGMDFTDMVYASPPRPNNSPGHPQQPSTSMLPQHTTAHVQGPINGRPQQPSPIIPPQQQHPTDQVQGQQPTPISEPQQQKHPTAHAQGLVNGADNPNSLHPQQQQHGKGQEHMRMQIQQMLAATQLPQHLQHQQQNIHNLQTPQPQQQQQQIQNLSANRLAASNLTHINHARPASVSIATADYGPPQQRQPNATPLYVPPQTDDKGRVFYDV